MSEMHVPSLRGRKRKTQSQSMAWDPARTASASLPRASRAPGASAAAQKRPYYNIIFGREQEDDIADTLVDTLDLIAPRDLSAARYALNHKLMDQIMGGTRLDMLKAPASPYERKNKEQLVSAAAALQREIQEMQRCHAAVKESFKLPKSSAALSQGPELESESEPTASAVPEPEAWARAPSQGSVLGIGYVRAQMPAEVVVILESQQERCRHRLEIQKAQHEAQQKAEEKARLVEQEAKYMKEQEAQQNQHQPEQETRFSVPQGLQHDAHRQSQQWDGNSKQQDTPRESSQHAPSQTVCGPHYPTRQEPQYMGQQGPS